jgi:rifampicin phosphotransferase
MSVTKMERRALSFIIPLPELGKDSLPLAGGKGANLGELGRAGMPVPDGFCLSTRAFGRFLAACPDLSGLYARLDGVDASDRAAVAQAGAEFRAHLGDLPVPEDVRAELLCAWRELGGTASCAVRSSATAEDLATASFAGQHDTFLNVTTESGLLEGVRRCWLSLFTDRAIGYRARYGFAHRQVALAVIVQRMVLPEVAGVMFTADPVSGHRRTIVINAAYGLGEAVVSGLVNPDLYRIGADGTPHKAITDKRLEIAPLPSGGVTRREVAPGRRNAQALPDEHIAALAALGRRIQRHFGTPQDIEWAWADGRIHVLQSRPITSLYPLPATPADDRLHVYFSFGHQQMMTEAIKPLGISFLRAYFPFGRRLAGGESRQMAVAGSRVFFDYTDALHSRLAAALVIRGAGWMDERVGRALREIRTWPEFRRGHRLRLGRDIVVNVRACHTLARVIADLCWTNMDTKQAKSRAFMDKTIRENRAAIGHLRGADRIAWLQSSPGKFAARMFFRLTLTQACAMIAGTVAGRLSLRWLGDTSDVGPLARSVPGNVTTEMAMALGDLADLARGEPALVALLESPPRPFSLAAFDSVPGGGPFRQALESFLRRYGMRCPGEIDITRTRWADQPTQLFAGILANARTGGAGEHRARFRAGGQDAEEAAERILRRLRGLRWGRPKAAVMSRLIKVYRTLMGMREHLKFLTVNLFDIYRSAIRAEADSLVSAGVLPVAADADFLALAELRDLLAGRVPGGLAELIDARKAEYEAHTALTPPRLFTSDGEVISGSAAGPGKEGVLAGCPVSGGIAEGRARVVLRPEDAELREGDILVAPFTDPAWTLLFAAVRGLVLEVGGVMTHGAVIAREMGLPAVVGIDGATRLIADGQRVRVDGHHGTVELVRD